MQSSSEEFALAQPPEDGITRVRFAPNTQLLAVSSWDTSVRIYDVAGNTMRYKYAHKGAVLDTTFDDSLHVYSGGLDKSVCMFDTQAERQTELGQHGDAVRTVNWCGGYNLLVTGGWDAALKFWDVRQPDALVATCMLPERAYAADVTHTGLIVIGTAARHVWIWDVRDMTQPQQRRMSSLKFQTRCIRAFPDASGYALSSTEGRISMEIFNTSKEAQLGKYAFRCHREVVEKVDYAYPVNAIAFRPNSTQFATGGGDCTVPLWDTAAKKRLFVLPKYQTSISSLDFDHTGKYLAVAASYTFEELDKEHPADAIFIRTM